MIKEYKILESIDPSGRIIFYKDKIYRGIFEEKSDEIRGIYNLFKKENLLGDLIINTKIVENFSMPGFDLILEHERIDKMVCKPEYSSLMIFDAGLLVLELLEKIDDMGLAMIDSHIHNVAFYNGKFVWFDFGSFQKGKTKRYVFKEFIDYYINSLIMLEKKQFKKNQICNLASFSHRDIEGHLNFTERIKYFFSVINILNAASSGNTKKALKLLKSLFLSYQPSFKELKLNKFKNENTNEMHYEDNLVTAFINKKGLKDITIIGGKNIYYGLLAEKRGISTIVCNIDHQCINNIFNEIKSNKLKKVFPAVLNFLCSTPPMLYGIPTDITHFYYSFGSTPARGRYKSELVIAETLIHHLVFFQQARFETIVRQLKDFTSRYLIVEFIKPIDETVKELMSEKFNWYTLDNFKAELNKEFNILQCTDKSYSRTNIVCETK